MAMVNTVREPHKGMILQSQGQEELPPSFHCGDAPRDALLPSVLRPQGGALKGEL